MARPPQRGQERPLGATRRKAKTKKTPTKKPIIPEPPQVPITAKR